MAKRIIFIHGRAQKPSKQALQSLWYGAIKHGLEYDFGQDAVKAFDKTGKDFVYYGNLSNEFLEVPTENPESRRKSLDELMAIPRNKFNKAMYKERSEMGFLKEALADIFSASAGKLGVAEPLITKIAPDMAHYWNPYSYFGSDVRNTLTPVLQKAFDNKDDIMLVSHSLGTMVSFDNLWKFSHYGEYRHKYGEKKRVDLFVTLGSPLGDENVKSQLKGNTNVGALKYPLNINRWVNIAAEDDFISHDGKLANDYKEMSKLGILSEPIIDVPSFYNLNVRNGISNPHSSIGYLINPKFIKILWDWMS